jgi:hypothetical protein
MENIVGIATGHTDSDQGVGVRVAVESRTFLLVVQTGFGAHPASNPIGTGGLSQGLKRLGYEADHSSPTSAEVKKTWIYTSTPPYAFMA